MDPFCIDVDADYNEPSSMSQVSQISNVSDFSHFKTTGKRGRKPKTSKNEVNDEKPSNRYIHGIIKPNLNEDQRQKLEHKMQRESIMQQEEQIELQLNESMLHSALRPMPELSVDQLESSLQQYFMENGNGNESKLQQLQKRASDLQKMYVQDVISSSKEILNDQKGITALNEEAPLTFQNLGISSNQSMAELRQIYSSIINNKNDIANGLMQCDCCLSQRNDEPGNQLVFCVLCLGAVHVKCHARKLLYAYSEDMTDFTCERCRFIIDNQPHPAEIKEIFRCRFCPEEKGIKIYIDKHPHYKNTSKLIQYLNIGWTHLSCVFWNLFCEFANETRFEVKQNPRLKLYRHQVCKYCNLEMSVFKGTSCGYRKGGMRCQRPFHVMCAIKRGLITDWETMERYQTVNGRVVAMCSMHTRQFRVLGEMPEQSRITYQSVIDQHMERDEEMVQCEHDEETFTPRTIKSHLDQDAQYHNIYEAEFGAAEQNPFEIESENPEDQIGTIDIDEHMLDSENTQSIVVQPCKSNKKKTKLYIPNITDLRNNKVPNTLENQIKFRKALDDPEVQKMMQIDQEKSQNEHLRKDMNVHLKMGHVQDVKFKFQQKQFTPVYSFSDRLRMQQLNERSGTNLENEFSMQQSLVPATNMTQGNTTVSQLQSFFQKQKVRPETQIVSSTRPDLNEEAYFKERMNRGEKIMFDVIPELTELMAIPSVSDRVTIQTRFVEYCVDNDIVDLHCHQYNIGRCSKLRALLGTDTIQSQDLFKHLRGLIRPFSVVDRALEQKRFQHNVHTDRLAIMM